MRVDGVLSHGPMRSSYVCSTQAARGCSWLGGSPRTYERSLPMQCTGCSCMRAGAVLSLGPMSDPYLCSAQGARGCARVGCYPMGPRAIPACAAPRMLVDARGWGALSHGPMSDSYLCSTQDARGCSWMGCSPMDSWAILTCASHRMLVDAPGWGAFPWGHGRFLPVQRTGCSWMLVDGVLSHGAMSDAYLCRSQDARRCS